MEQSKRILYFILYWVLYSGLISIYIVRSEIIQIIPDIALIVLLFKKNTFNFSKAINYIGKIPFIFLLLFLIIGSISAIINLVPFTSYLWLLHYYIRYWILLICVISIFNRKDVVKSKLILYKAAIINIILCIIQNIMGITGDDLGGTFAGGNSEIALLIIAVTIIGSTDYANKILSLSKALFILIGFFLIAILGEIKFLYFMIPITICISYMLCRSFSIKQILILILITILFVPIMKFALSIYYNDDYINFVFDAKAMQNELRTAHNFKENGMNRSTTIEITSKYILNNEFELTLGKGIGNGAASSLFQSETFSKYKDYNYQVFTPSYIMVETGAIGFLLYCSIYGYFLVYFIKYYYKYKDKRIRHWASYGITTSLMTGMFIWYNAHPIFNYLLYYFLFSLYIIAIKQRKKELYSLSRINKSKSF